MDGYEEYLNLVRSDFSTIRNEENSENNKKTDLHRTHCDKCFNLNACKKLVKTTKRHGYSHRSKETADSFTISSSSSGAKEDSSITCPVILCAHGCSHKFHACKAEEHELLCPRVKVPCINVNYGCPFVLERRLRGSHLQVCPASVVVCTMEWNRWPLPPGKCQPFAFDKEQLDVAVTLRDQKTITDWKRTVPSTLRNMLRSYTNVKHPTMPLGVSGHRIPNSILTQAAKENEMCKNGEIFESDDSDPEENSDSPWGAKRCPPGLQESVCTKLKTIKITNGHDTNDHLVNPSLSCTNDKSNTDDEEDDFLSCSSGKDSNYGYVRDDLTNGAVQETGYQKVTNHEIQNGSCRIDMGKGTNNSLLHNGSTKEVELNLTVEIVTKYQCKPEALYTFICAREFRRDEYPSHFHEVHSKIHTQLNGWLFTRCPMANEGCSFGVERMFPISPEYRVRYNEDVDAFCTTQKETEETDKNEKFNLASLPNELLLHLTKYLDPLSLNALSMTSLKLREVCECIVAERGIVVLHWEKIKTEKYTGWQIVGKKWFFSTAFSPIKTWTFNDTGKVNNHMKTCPCFERNVQKHPFRYPILGMSECPKYKEREQ